MPRHFASYFQRAVKRRTRSPHPVAISVSGGLDSSAIFCSAAAIADGAARRLHLHVARRRDIGRECVRRRGRAGVQAGRSAYVDAPCEGLLFQSAEHGPHRRSADARRAVVSRRSTDECGTARQERERS